MKKLLLLLALCFAVGCSVDGDDCNCEAKMTYEFAVSSMGSPSDFSDYPKNPETGNYIKTHTESVPCGTSVDEIDPYEVFGPWQDLSMVQVTDEEITVNCK